MAPRRLTDEEILSQIPAATERGRIERSKKRWARAAHFDVRSGNIVVELANGIVFGFPARLAQGLQNGTPTQLAEIEISPSGDGLHWEALDADMSVTALLHGIFGNKAWMQELGRAGGRSRSAAKKRAARLNGAHGGRPRGVRKSARASVKGA